MKLYTSKLAPNPQRVELFLKEKNAFDKVEIVEFIDITESWSDEHKARNPYGKVPVLELDNGKFLSESRAICTYLEGVFPEPNLMGKDFEERAFIEMWDRRIEMGYFITLAQYIRHSHPALAALEKPQLPEWASVNRERLGHFAHIVNIGLENSKFVAGERFTIADITLFSAVNFGRLGKVKIWEEFDNIARWRNEILQRPAFQ